MISDIELKIGCFAHTLDLAAKKAVAVARTVTKKMKQVIGFFHKSLLGNQVLKNLQIKLNVHPSESRDSIIMLHSCGVVD